MAQNVQKVDRHVPALIDGVSYDKKIVEQVHRHVPALSMVFFIT